MQRLNDKIESLRPNRKKPTHYPFLLFHGIRGMQLLSAIITGAVMYYFIWHLRHGNWSVPWTFVFISAAASGTVVALAATMILHCCQGLNPGLNVTLNGSLFVIWALGLSLLSWWASGTLTHHCSLVRWHEENGQHVCRVYKALYAFTVTGFVATAAALVLDIFVIRKSVARGRYNQMQDLDDKRGYPLQDNDAWRTSTEHLAPTAAHIPTGEINRQRPYEEEGASTAAAQPLNSGYAQPEEQFGRYDTEYHGHGGGRGRSDGAF